MIPVANGRFASENIRPVQVLDPETGHYFDDTQRYIDAVPWLSDADRRKIFESNARHVYPRIDRWLESAPDAVR